MDCAERGTEMPLSDEPGVMLPAQSPFGVFDQDSPMMEGHRAQKERYCNVIKTLWCRDETVSGIGPFGKAATCFGDSITVVVRNASRSHRSIRITRYNRIFNKKKAVSRAVC